MPRVDIVNPYAYLSVPSLEAFKGFYYLPLAPGGFYGDNVEVHLVYELYDLVEFGVAHVGVYLGAGLCPRTQSKGFDRPAK